MDQTRANIVNAVERAPLLEEPFVHFCLERTFAQSIVHRLDRFWPDPDLFEKEAGAGKNRYCINQVKLRPLIQGFEPEAREFWHYFEEDVVLGALYPALLEKFLPSMRYRFGEQLGALTFCTGFEIINDFEAHTFGVHTDPPHIVFAALIYLPSDDSRPELGTTAYAPRDARTRDIGKKFYVDPREVEETFTPVRRFPYKSNFMFAMLNSTRSWHGLDRLPEGDYARRLIMLRCNLEAPSFAILYGDEACRQFDEGFNPEDAARIFACKARADRLPPALSAAAPG